MLTSFPKTKSWESKGSTAVRLQAMLQDSFPKTFCILVVVGSLQWAFAHCVQHLWKIQLWLFLANVFTGLRNLNLWRDSGNICAFVIPVSPLLFVLSGFCLVCLFVCFVGFVLVLFVLNVANKIFCCSDLKLVCRFLASPSCRITIFISQL